MTETDKTELTEAEVGQLREQLRAAEASLSGDVINRLGEARMAALAASTKRRRPQVLVPLGVAASLAVAILVGYQTLRPNSDSDQLIADASTDVDLVLALDEQEMIDDMEFYHWMASETQ